MAELTGPRASDGFAVPDGRASAAVMPGRTAGRDATARAAARASLPEGAAGRLSALAASGLRDELSDAEAVRNAGHGGGGAGGTGPMHAIEGRGGPQQGGGHGGHAAARNLPAVLRGEADETGSDLSPCFHMVRHLPGYLQQPIRALGRSVFAQFTDTPVEDIQVLTTLINPRKEVESLLQWLRVNGARDDRAEMDFEGTVPDYRADVQLWRTRNLSFLVVKDFAGYYVYGWPGGRGVHLDHDEAPRTLR